MKIHMMVGVGYYTTADVKKNIREEDDEANSNVIVGYGVLSVAGGNK